MGRLRRLGSDKGRRPTFEAAESWEQLFEWGGAARGTDGQPEWLAVEHSDASAFGVRRSVKGSGVERMECVAQPEGLGRVVLP